MMSHFQMIVNNGLQVEHSIIGLHNSTTGGQLIYSVTGELKWHNLCLKHPPFSLTQVWVWWQNCIIQLL